MSILVRSRNDGQSFERGIKHRLLEKPFYATFQTEEEARVLGTCPLGRHRSPSNVGFRPLTHVKPSGTHMLSTALLNDMR